MWYKEKETPIRRGNLLATFKVFLWAFRLDVALDTDCRNFQIDWNSNKNCYKPNQSNARRNAANN